MPHILADLALHVWGMPALFLVAGLVLGASPMPLLKWYRRARLKPMLRDVLGDLNRVRASGLDEEQRALLLYETEQKCNAIHGPLKRAGFMPPDPFIAGDVEMTVYWIDFIGWVQREIS